MVDQSETPTHRVRGFVLRALLFAGAITALWAMAPGSAKALPGGSGLGGAVGSAVETVGGAAGSAVETVVGVADTATGATSQTVGTVADTATQTVGSAADTTTGALGAVGDTVGGAVEAVEPVTGTVAVAVDATLGAATQTVDQTLGAAGETVDQTLEAAGETLDRALGAASAVVHEVVGSDPASLDPTTPSAGPASPAPAGVDISIPDWHLGVGAPAGDSPSAAHGAEPGAPIGPTPWRGASSIGSTRGPARVPNAPVPTRPDTPTATAGPGSGLGGLDILRGGSSTQDVAVLATLLLIALAVARWSRREAEHRLSPVFLSLVERPG